MFVMLVVCWAKLLSVLIWKVFLISHWEMKSRIMCWIQVHDLSCSVQLQADPPNILGLVLTGWKSFCRSRSTTTSVLFSSPSNLSSEDTCWWWLRHLSTALVIRKLLDMYGKCNQQPLFWFLFWLSRGWTLWAHTEWLAKS